MNILALMTDAFGSLGGIAQYNRDLVAALARCSDANRVVVLPRLGSADAAALPAGVCQLAPHGDKVAYSLAALRVALTRGPFDAVFCGHLYMGPLAAVIARILRVPLWLQLHGREAWEPMDRWQRWAAERASLVTAVSRYTRRRFLAFTGVDPARVRVLPNTVATGFAPGPKPIRLLDRHALHGKKVLLTVGRLAPDERGKGHDKVIDALPVIVAAYPDLVYLVAGTGGDQARLEALARQRGVARHMLFVGQVDPDELADYYRLADVFVMPSTQEGFGIVFLEAAASGLKLIGGNRDGSVDALADGAIGTAVDPDSRDGLVRAVLQAIAGEGPDSAGVERFRFDSFARMVCELAGSHLLGRSSQRAA
jgi:phosphatidylinositol alpha-1,6-mannosyltransferase